MTQLAPNRFDLSINGIRHNVFRCRPELKTPPSAMLDQGYWAHVSVKMRMGDIVEVLPEDCSYFSRLLVLDAGKLYAKVAVIEHVEINKADDEIEDVSGYEIKWRGPSARYGVIRGKDVLKDGFVSKLEAKTWIDETLLKAA